MAVFSSPVSACEVDFVKFYGTITDTDGDPYVGHEVEIQKQCFWPIQWRSTGSAVTDSNDHYEIVRNVRGYTFVFNENDTYRMLIDNNQVAQQYIIMIGTMITAEDVAVFRGHFGHISGTAR